MNRADALISSMPFAGYKKVNDSVKLCSEDIWKLNKGPDSI